MVYVTNDGDVIKSTPWRLRTVFRFFIGVIHIIIMFCIVLSFLYNAGNSFQTLINPGINGRNQYSRDSRLGFRSRSSTRELGRPNTGNNVDIPFFGGCSSCAR